MQRTRNGSEPWIQAGRASVWDAILLQNSQAPANWSNFIQIQGTPRVMQLGVRYNF